MHPPSPGGASAGSSRLLVMQPFCIMTGLPRMGGYCPRCLREEGSQPECPPQCTHDQEPHSWEGPRTPGTGPGQFQPCGWQRAGVQARLGGPLRSQHQVHSLGAEWALGRTLRPRGPGARKTSNQHWRGRGGVTQACTSPRGAAVAPGSQVKDRLKPSLLFKM